MSQKLRNEKSRARVERLAHVLDSAIRIPGTNIRFGWDAVVGLVPGIGDALTSGLAMYIVYVAYRAGLPGPVLVRMLANVGIDGLVGSVPMVGDLFDAGFKANKRNAKLLEQAVSEAPEKRSWRSRLWLALIALAFVLIALLPVALGTWLLLELLQN